MNYLLTLQYDGTNFHGWQMQGAQRTVQSELTRVISMLEGRPVIVHGSGRTDAGVHAEGQTATVQLDRPFTEHKLRAAINGNLDRDLRVMSVRPVPDDFHARFSARGKTYIYRIVSGPAVSPFWSRYALHEGRPIDMATMHRAASLFLGRHDWTAFSSIHSEARSRVRTISRMEVSSRWDERGCNRLIEITASADGFLRYMVRLIAGTLLAAGRGEIDMETIERAIDTGDRSLVAPTAAAHGLTLVRVHYDRSIINEAGSVEDF